MPGSKSVAIGGHKPLIYGTVEGGLCRLPEVASDSGKLGLLKAARNPGDAHPEECLETWILFGPAARDENLMKGRLHIAEEGDQNMLRKIGLDG